MLDQRRVAAQPDEKREQLFTERYQNLLAWAMRLTNHQREAAEDLVQDAFVQFVSAAHDTASTSGKGWRAVKRSCS